MSRLARLFALPALLMLCCPPTANAGSKSAGNAAADLERLFADDWEFRLRESPLFATRMGDLRYNDRLSDESLAAVQARLTEKRAFLERLRAIPREKLSVADRLNHDIYGQLREDSIAEDEFRAYLMPITNRSGFHVSFPQITTRVPLTTERHYEDYVARLRAFAVQTDQYIERMREGIRLGYVLPRIVLEGYEGAIEPHVVADPTESLLWKPFEEFPAAMPAAARERLAAAGRAAIAEAVVPAYRTFLDFMAREYYPAARETIGASALPNGEAFYAHRVRRYTTLPLDPETVHRTGRAEVKRIRAEMEALIASTGFEGDFADFLVFLRTDGRFYAETPEQLMQETALVLKRMDGQLPKLFGKLPRMPYGIEAIPDYIAPKTTTAYYDSPSGDGKSGGTYFVNTYDLPSRPLYEIEALSLHEAVPGHHLQLALQQELEGVPNFRRFSGFTAFVEGWALYSERLGLEVGFYQDPFSDFGRLTYEMWRATRLVVDTGMHALGWSRQRAIDFMEANTALSLHNVETEVDRYIAWPGQALAYKTGELKISELRRQAEAALGERFDLRAFHDVVLGSGSVPLTVLEGLVAEFIAQSAAAR